MNFNNPIPRSGLPRFHESSRLRSPRDSDATQRLWQKHRDAGKQAQANSLAIENLQRQVARIRTKKSQSETVGHPFKIRRSADWLTYRVGDGIIIATGDPVTVINPTDEDFPISAGVARFWFYIEMSSTVAEIKTSSTTQTWSATLIPIGWVDTLTHESEEASIITQFLKDNVFNPCAT
jgi:hypothetical protein